MDRPHFSHLALTVRDLDRQGHFYCTALGFRGGPEYRSRGTKVGDLMEVAPTGFRGAFLALDGFLLELLEYVDPEPGTLPRRAAEPGFAHISLVVADLSIAVAGVQLSGGALRQRFEHSFTGAGALTKIAFCVDPEGNRVELIEHSDPGEADGHATFLGLDTRAWPPTE